MAGYDSLSHSDGDDAYRMGHLSPVHILNDSLRDGDMTEPMVSSDSSVAYHLRRRTTKLVKDLSSKFFDIVPWTGWLITAVLLSLVLGTLAVYENKDILQPSQKDNLTVITSTLILLLGLNFSVSVVVYP